MATAVLTPTTRTPFAALPVASGPSFLPFGFLGRLPSAMLPLGLLLFVTDLTGSFGSGGLVLAALSVGAGVAGPVVGMLADRFGHRIVGLTAALAGGSLIALFLLVVAQRPQLPVMLGLAALIGASGAQVGSLARSRWVSIARTRDDREPFVSSAMAYESAVDETSFVVGPVLVSTLAGVFDPTVGLVCALVLTVVGQAGFALHPTALPGSRHLVREGARASLPVWSLVPLVIAVGSVGVVFGSTQTGVAATLEAQGDAALTGVVYACLGVGSAVAGLATTRLPARIRLATRITLSGLLLAVLGLGLVLAQGPWLLGLACLGVGLAVAPILVSGYSLAERLTPAGRGATVMTLLATATVVGVAAGAAVAGQLVDQVSASGALAVPILGGLAAATAGLVLRRR